MTHFRFRQLEDYVSAVGSSVLDGKPPYDCQAETEENALAQFAAEFNLTDVSAMGQDWLKNKVVHGNDQNDDSITVYCNDCNDYHGYWIIETITE